MWEIFKDNNEYNEKSIIGFGAFTIMVLFAMADVETMLMDSNQKVDRLTSKLTASHQEVQRMRTQLEAHDKDLVYQTRLAERVKREQEQLPSPPPCTRAPLREAVQPGGGVRPAVL